MNFLRPLDAIPNPWTRQYAYGLATASVAVITLVSLRAGELSIVPALAAWLVALGSVYLWNRNSSEKKPRNLTLAVLPLLWFALFLVTGILLGNPGAGGFPAVFALLFSLVILVTKDIEAHFPGENPPSTQVSVHTVFHCRLNWVSVILFVFGVITLWPWLGGLYNFTYFWILVLGVLTPIMYLWGRLRQPHKEDSYTALLRFNRVIPYMGFILLLAIALG